MFLDGKASGKVSKQIPLAVCLDYRYSPTGNLYEIYAPRPNCHGWDFVFCFVKDIQSDVLLFPAVAKYLFLVTYNVSNMKSPISLLTATFYPTRRKSLLSGAYNTLE